MTTLYIKNMVSPRCKIMVSVALRKLNLHCYTVDLGKVMLKENITLLQQEKLTRMLYELKLELMENKREILVERIKNVIVETIHYSDELPKTKFSNFLSETLNYDYTYLANVFKENQGIPIQQYLISHKIAKVKELIYYDELNLSEIAWKLHFCNVSHLSNQFKKVTGQTPRDFKACKQKKLSHLEDL